MKHTFVNLLALTTLFSINSCNTATEPLPTDATRAEIFHGRPKTLHTATYPAHSNAGEWFKDTTAGQIPHTVSTYNLSGELTSETHAIDDSTTYTIQYEYTAGSPRKKPRRRCPCKKMQYNRSNAASSRKDTFSYPSIPAVSRIICPNPPAPKINKLFICFPRLLKFDYSHYTNCGQKKQWGRGISENPPSPFKKSPVPICLPAE